MSFAGAVMILAISVIRALAINLLPKKTFLALWGIAAMRRVKGRHRNKCRPLTKSVLFNPQEPFSFIN